ncbi:MAG: response regulator transcription factor [Myxococcaceae bacterium]|nr:response regulator transcription factor [Myxococcaceae bacterium]
MRGLPPQIMPLRVVVQADHSLVESLAEQTDRFILSPVESNLEIAARVAQADVIVVDVTRDPQRALAEMKNLQLKRPLLALAAREQAADALAAGAQAVLPREISAARLEVAIAAVQKGFTVSEPGWLQAGAQAGAGGVESGHPVDDNLTPREHEVLVLLAEGLSNKQIAAKLTISEHTAKFHVNSILQKMDAQKRVEAVVRAARRGLINL